MRRKFFVLAIILVFLFIPGCWDNKDVNDLAFVLGIGIDEPINPERAKYLVTFEFAKPVPISSDPTTRSKVASMEAKSIREAIQRVQTEISRSISLSHIRMIVIGENVARNENFQDLASYIMKEPDAALQLRLIFVHNAQARDAFFTSHRFEERLAGEIVAMGLLQKELSFVRTNTFLNFIIDLKQNNGTAFGSRVAIDKGESGEDIIVREGAAVYKDWKLASWFTAEEARAANWLVEDTEVIVVAEEGSNIYTYEVDKQKVKIKPSMKDGNPFFLVQLTTEGMILEEVGRDLDLSEQKNLKNLEVLFAEEIKHQLQSAIDKSQNEIKADYLGFGKAFKKYDKKIYKSLNWPEVYPNIPIEVEVACDVKAYGLRK